MSGGFVKRGAGAVGLATPLIPGVRRAMRRASRTARRRDAFDKRFDQHVACVLTDAGFVEGPPYAFGRRHAAGEDVVLFDVEVKSFMVLVSYRPPYIEEIDELYEGEGAELSTSSYLAPTRMLNVPKEYPCRLAKARDHSFRLIRRGLQKVALPWLRRVQDPAAYAESVAPEALMYVGRANEVAGQLEVAREAYEEMMRRLLECWKLTPDPAKFAEFEGARTLVYLSAKLDRHKEIADPVQQFLGFSPTVEPLRAY